MNKRPSLLIAIVALSGCGSRGDAAADARPREATSLANEADRLLEASVPLDYMRPMITLPLDRFEIRDLYWRACEDGDARSCWMVGQVHDMLVVSENLDQRVLANCESGDVMSCRVASEPLRLDSRATPGELEARCRAGMPGSCERLWSAQTTPHKRPRIDDLFRKGCARDIMSECQQLEMSSETSAEERRRLSLRRCTVTLDCRSPSDPETGSRMWIPELLERGCQYGNTDEQCQTLVQLYESKREPEPIRGRATLLHHWLCTPTQQASRDSLREWCTAHPPR